MSHRTTHHAQLKVNARVKFPANSTSRSGDVAVYVSDINQSICPLPCILFLCLFLFNGPFNCISFHKYSRQLSAFSLCTSSLISALLLLSTIYLFMKVSFCLDIILCGWTGLKHRLTIYKKKGENNHQVRINDQNHSSDACLVRGTWFACSFSLFSFSFFLRICCVSVSLFLLSACSLIPSSPDGQSCHRTWSIHLVRNTHTHSCTAGLHFHDNGINPPQPHKKCVNQSFTFYSCDPPPTCSRVKWRVKWMYF